MPALDGLEHSALTSDFDQANSHPGAAIRMAPTHDRIGSTQQEIPDLKDAQLTRQAETRRTRGKNPPGTRRNEEQRRSFDAL